MNDMKAQQIVQGVEAVDGVLQSLDAHKVFLVVDSSFRFLSIRDRILSMKVPYVMFDRFSPNPLYEDVCEGVSLFLKEGCDAIVAVGGGSCIDVAKCVKLYCKMDPSVNYLRQDGFDSGIPVVAVPTTAGTGSESTRFAVIYFEGEKQSVNHLSIIPDCAILDHTVLATLPLYQKKCTVFDALCQSIESWWSINSTDESKRISAEALKLIVENIETYIFMNDVVASSQIMKGANLAGQAINITQTTAPHAFSYKLTSLFGIPHGHAVALCMAEIWDYMICHTHKCVDGRGEPYLRETLQSIAKCMGCDSPEGAVAYFRRLLADCGMDKPVSERRVSDLDKLIHSVNPVRMKNHPVALDMESIAFLYDRIVK